ncbi:acetoacetate decarboxylase family protein [Nonomuraea sp. NPDC046570]|uniref:acetoacetate decarboxylase family protein n=1 Tax=Nonomuraea sp. NPDC046570 TaxID=3155255 RepID=UPI0033F38C3C
MAAHLIQGREIILPVRVRQATVGGAMYAVRADAARAVIAYSGLDVAEAIPGKAVCALVFIDYTDSDLDAYHEFGVAFLVRPPEMSGPASVSELWRAGVFVHWLPVDQGFTMEAGRAIWGFPKELADIELRLGSPYKRCLLRKDDRLVIDLLTRPGVPLPGATRIPAEAYTHRDGVTRRIPWTMTTRSLRARPGGSMIRLGNHPIAKELSELGLPKRPLLTVTCQAAMSFGPATAL